jgi:tRNA threonylcarbamoyladenosine biosynthesis protein TsaE
MRRWRSASVEATRAIGAELARELVPDGCLLLFADLGSGKTVLAQGIARGLGVDEREVQSPTYTLLREHGGAEGSLLHVDLYRLSPAEVAAAGFEEALLGPGVKVVEWAERLPFPVPGARALAIRTMDGGERELEEIEPPQDGAAGASAGRGTPGEG